jgi:hypothetical protein
MWKTITATLIAVLLSGAAHAQTCLTDPVFGAQRNAYGPGVHMDATGRAYRDTPSNAWVFEQVRPNAYGPGVGSDTLGGVRSCRRTTCPTSPRARATRGIRRRPTAPRRRPSAGPPPVRAAIVTPREALRKSLDVVEGVDVEQRRGEVGDG